MLKEASGPGHFSLWSWKLTADVMRSFHRWAAALLPEGSGPTSSAHINFIAGRSSEQHLWAPALL